MSQPTIAAFPEHFASLPDPRVVGRTAYPLENIIFIAVTAVICGGRYLYWDGCVCQSQTGMVGAVSGSVQWPAFTRYLQ